MRGPKDTVGVPDVRSRRSFFRIEIVRQDQALEMKPEFTPDFYHSEVRVVCGPFFSTTFGHMFSLPFLCGRVSWPQLRQQKLSVSCGLTAGTRNHHARSILFSYSFSKHPPGF